MKTQAQVFQAIKNGRESQCLDGRDYERLIRWYPVEDWAHFGFEYTGEAETKPAPNSWTREAILRQLRRDAAFGLEKQEGGRGISTMLMAAVCKMWLWILEDGPADVIGFDELLEWVELQLATVPAPPRGRMAGSISVEVKQ